MAYDSIGTRIVLEGEKEYRQAISNINKDMRVLSSELKAVSAEFSGNANSIEALTKKGEILKKQYDEQVKMIQTLNGALDKAKETYGENSNQVKNWQIKLNNAYAELAKLDGEIQNNNKYLEEAKASADGTAKSIDEFGKEVKEAGEHSEKANKSFAAVAAGVTALGIAMKKAAESAFNLARGAAAYADDILTLSNTTGLSIETLQELNYMQELIDVSMDTMTSSMNRQIRSMANAQRGLKEASEAYEKLGIEVTDADGTLRDGAEVFWEVIDALGAMKNETERDAIAMQLMGRSARELAPLMNIGSQGIAEFAKEAREVGAVLDRETLEKLGETDDAFQRMNQSVEIAKRKLGIELAPVATQAMQKITDKLTDADGKFTQLAKGGLNLTVETLGWVVDNADLVVGGISGIVAGMAAFKVGSAIQTGLTAAIASWKAYKTATEGATVAQWAFNTAISSNPIGLAAVAIGAVASALTIFALNTKNATNETSAFASEVNNAIKASAEFNKQISDNIKTRREQKESIEAEYGVAQKLADRIFDLAEKENKSNTEKAEMVSLVEELNKAIPELNLTLNEETGLLSLQRDEVEKLIQSNLDLAKVKVAQEDLTRIARDQFEAEKQLVDLKEKEKMLTEQLNQARARIGLSEGEVSVIGKTSREVQELEAQMFDLRMEMAAAEGSIRLLNEEWEETTGYINRNKKAVEELNESYRKAGKDIVIAESELAAEMDRLYKERQKKESANLEHRREMINEHYDKLSEDLDDSIWEERRALEKAQKAQLDSLKAANNQELRLLEEQHNKKLALINKEYLEKIKLVDEERYAALKNIDDEINAIKEKSRQEEAARKAEEEEKKRQELLEKIQNAKSINQYKAAQQELAEFEARLQYERELAEREAQIEILEQRKATINESYDAQIKALQDEQKQKENAAKQEYELEKNNLKDILDLKVKELQEKQELEDRAYQKKWNQMKENLRKEKEEAIRNAKEIYDTNLELFKNSEKLKLDAMKSLSEKAIEEQKKIGENLADAMYKGYSERNMAILPLYEKTIDQIPDRTKKILGIQSPSKVFMKLGEYTAEGFELGFKERMAKVNRELSIAMPTVSALTGRNISTASAPVGGRSTNVTLHIDTFVNNRPEDVYALMTEIDFIARQHAIAGGAR